METRRIAFGSPSRYIQGDGEIRRLSEHTKVYGERVLAIIDEFFFETLRTQLEKNYAPGCFLAYCYREEVTKKRIEACAAEAQKFQANVIVGIGGGKTIDTAKAVADFCQLPIIIMPTSASTDAPTSAMSVIYNDRHEHDDVYYYPKNPDLVLVDTGIIADAPTRFLVSGMGDALATVYEARATMQSKSSNYINQEQGPFYSTRMAMAIAEECAKTIYTYGVEAKHANDAHVVNEALDAVVEANILMSGLGFENVGCAASHVICNGITDTEHGNKALHGEKVAFGILCQRVAEGAESEEITKIQDFYSSVGLPITLQEVFTEPTEENYKIISANTKNTEWTREPFPMTDEAVMDVVKKVQALGEEYRREHETLNPHNK